MTTSLLTFKTRLRGPLGRNDTVADGFITQGVNFACTLISMLYQPPELQTSGTLTILASTPSLSLGTLTRLQNLNNIWNVSGSNKVWHIPFYTLDLVSPLTTATAVYNRFYSREGSTIHVRPQSTLANTLTAYYTQFPLVVSDDGDEISFSNFDSQVEAYALTYAMACLEESEVSAVWQKIGEVIGVPQQILIKTRRYLEGGPTYGDNLKGT